jgi:MGT family glycosyltransferase
MARIALLSTGMPSHIAALGRLASVLRRQGHQLTAWAPAEFQRELKVAGADVVPHEPVPARVHRDGLVELAADLAEAAEWCAGELADQLLAHDIELVVHDVHVPWARIAADFLGLPRIVSWPLFPSRTLGPTAPRSAPRLDWAGSEEARVAGADDSIIRRFGVRLGDWRGALWNRGETIVSFSTAEVTGVPEKRFGWTYVGPLMDPAPPRRSVPDRRLVYVSFGTYFNIRRQGVLAAIEALAGEPVEVIVSTGRTALRPGDLGRLPANVTVHEFVAARDVLAEADVLVTHGGIASVHEALLAGVPMVCVPQGYDQFDGSRRVQELGAGLTVGTSAAEIREATRQVLSDPTQAARTREVGERLAGFDGNQAVSELVRAVLGPDESRR